MLETIYENEKLKYVPNSQTVQPQFNKPPHASYGCRKLNPV